MSSVAFRKKLENFWSPGRVRGGALPLCTVIEETAPENSNLYEELHEMR